MSPADPADDVAVSVVDALEAHGVDPDTYRLHDHVDVDALEALLSAEADVTVRFTVEGVRVTVTPDGVTVDDGDVTHLSRR